MSYLNSFYMDVAAYLFMLQATVLYVRVLRWRRHKDWILLVISCLLLVTAKPQHAVLGFPVALLFLAQKGGSGTKRPVWVAIALVLVGIAVLCLRYAAPRVKRQERRYRMRALLFLFSLIVGANAQSQMRNTITFSGGWAQNVGGNCCGESAPSLSLSYAYRLFPHVDVEAGIVTALSLGTEVRGANYDIRADDRFMWVPFGLRGVLPLRRHRVEVSAAAGGAYEKYSVGNPADFVGLVSRDGWGGYASVAAAVALDGRRHFWLAASPHLFFANINQGYAHDRWFVLTVGIGLRF